MKKHRRPHGFGMLVVLIAVAIVLVLAAIQMKAILPSRSSTGPVGIEERPWLMEEFLVAGGETVKMPKSPKPVLNEPVTVQATALLDGMPRGRVEMTFKPDGRIEAAWESAYSHSEKQYTITATMAGNVVAKKTYTDEAGEKDKSRLFFVAKGRYKKETRSGETVISTEKGTAWISGWINPDLTIEGFTSMHQTTDWVAVYTLTTTEL